MKFLLIGAIIILGISKIKVKPKIKYQGKVYYISPTIH